MRLTLKAVNKAIRAHANWAGEEFVQGNGYFYFSGGNSERWRQARVCVYRLNELNLAQWVDFFDSYSNADR